MEESGRHIVIYSDDTLAHHGVKGQTWGKRNYQNLDGSLTAEGRIHYGYGDSRVRGAADPSAAQPPNAQPTSPTLSRRAQSRIQRMQRRQNWGFELTSRDPSTMSMQEMDAAMARARKEREYYNLQQESRPERFSKAKELAKQFTDKFISKAIEKGSEKISQLAVDKATGWLTDKLGANPNNHVDFNNMDLANLSDQQVQAMVNRHKNEAQLNKAQAEYNRQVDAAARARIAEMQNRQNNPNNNTNNRPNNNPNDNTDNRSNNDTNDRPNNQNNNTNTNNRPNNDTNDRSNNNPNNRPNNDTNDRSNSPNNNTNTNTNNRPNNDTNDRSNNNPNNRPNNNTNDRSNNNPNNRPNNDTNDRANNNPNNNTDNHQNSNTDNRSNNTNDNTNSNSSSPRSPVPTIDFSSLHRSNSNDNTYRTAEERELAEINRGREIANRLLNRSGDNGLSGGARAQELTANAKARQEGQQIADRLMARADNGENVGRGRDASNAFDSLFSQIDEANAQRQRREEARRAVTFDFASLPKESHIKDIFQGKTNATAVARMNEQRSAEMRETERLLDELNNKWLNRPDQLRDEINKKWRRQ